MKIARSTLLFLLILITFLSILNTHSYAEGSNNSVSHVLNQKDKEQIHAFLKSGEGIRYASLGDSTEAVGTYGDTTHANLYSGQTLLALSMITDDENFIPIDKSKNYYLQPTFGTGSSDFLYPRHRLMVSQNPSITYTIKQENPTKFNELTVYYLERTSNMAAKFDITVGGVTTTIDSFTPPVEYNGNKQNVALRIAKKTVKIPPTELEEVTIDNVDAKYLDGSVSTEGVAFVFGFTLGKGVEFRNYAVSSSTLKNNSSANQFRGVTTDERLQKAYDMDANIISIGWGTNDSKIGISSPSDFKKDLEQRIDEIRGRNPNTVILLNTDPKGVAGSQYENNYLFNDVIRETAYEKNVNLLDVESIMDEEYYKDSVHPNKLGHEKIGKEVSKMFDLKFILDQEKELFVTVNEVFDTSTQITGTAEKHSMITVKSGTKVLGKGNTNSEGNYSITIPKQKAGIVLNITAFDSSGNSSESVLLTVLDAIPPKTPVVDEVTDQSDKVTGKAEADSVIHIKNKLTKIGTVTTKADGTFLMDIDTQPAGSKLSVTATDKAGNVSAEKVVIVTDVTKPKKPVVNEVTDTTTSVSGIAETKSTVSIKSGTQEIAFATSKADGTFSIAITKQKSGTKLSVTATDIAGNTSEATIVTVMDVTAPPVPTVDLVTNQSEMVTGKAEVSSRIIIKALSTEIGTAIVKDDGKFNVSIAKQKAGTKLFITVIDTAGNSSETIMVTVSYASASAVLVVEEVTDQSTEVTGTAEAASNVSIKIDSSEVGAVKAAVDGRFSITIAKQRAGTKLTVTASDEAGNVSKVANLTVRDVTAPSAPIVDKITNKATEINGTTEARSDVIVKLGTKELAKGKTASNGKFSLAIEPQEISTELLVIATDAAGNQSSATKTIVVKADENVTNRISGSSRYLTAIAISQAGWDSAETVILATAADFPDALAGGPLAYQENVPILLTKTDTLTTETKKEIQRLGAKKVMVLGRTGAISAGVEMELKRMNLAVERIGGQTRFETAALIAEKLNSDKAVVANGLNFPDVLSVSSYAAKNGVPILLTRTDRLPKETRIALKNKTSTYVIGSTGAVSEGVFEDLPKPTRLGGKDRYETGYVVTTTLALATDKTYIATGMNFPDALAGSVLAAKNNAPILLVRQSAIPDATDRQLPKYDGFSIFGGTGAVSDSVKTLLDEALKK